MTTLAPENAPAEVVNARRTESLDARYILDLERKATRELFGRVDVVHLIEKAVLGVTLCNDNEQIMGHAAFFDYPNMQDVDSATWDEWVKKYYDCANCTPLNTLFMHYFVAKSEYPQGCAREIIRTAFNAVPDLHFLFLVVPLGIYPEPALADIFKPLQKNDGMQGSGSCIFVCHRHDHVPVLYIRKARVEDHDDLTPIFNQQSDMLKQTYGNFFLAELIEAQDDNMQCLVAEVEGTAVGFMSVSADVNVDLLNECFELGPFHGLKNPHADDELLPPKTPTPPVKQVEDVKVERSLSRTSSKSATSDKLDAAVVDSGKEVEKENSAEDQMEKKDISSQQSSRKSSRAGSTVGQEVKLKPKLSDANMGESTTSLLSDGIPADAVVSPIDESVPAMLSSPKALTQTALLPKRFVPKYKGQPSAFSIQLFCIDERCEMRSCDFLNEAFSLFPDCDFCVMTVPHLVPQFPLLQSFVRCTPRCPSILPQELYLFHRSGLLRDFKVRRVCKQDLIGINTLVQSIDLHENLLKDIEQYNMARRDQDGTEIQAFVAESMSQIVGVAVLRREEDIEYIRSHYNIEDFIYFNHHRRDEHGHLHHFALNPIFSHLSKHFLKEILRQGHKSCLYYPLYPSYTDKQFVEEHSMISVLNELVPVKSRRQIIYPLDKLGITAPCDRVLKQEEPYALNHINRKLVLEPKVTINARIVVVGASDVGLAFLEQLAYCPHLRFNNLTIISPHGIPGEMAPDIQRDLMLSTSHCYTQEEHAKVSLRSWVNVVYGKMTSLDRKKKQVIVNGKTLVPYDHLVLTMGQQYQVPKPTGDGNGDLPQSSAQGCDKTLPKNMFLVNDFYDAAVALYWIENNLLKSQKKAVVYGSSLDAYCCVQTLLSMGVTSDRVVLVEPPLTYQITCVNNATVEEAVKQTLQQCGVKIYSNSILTVWNDGNDGTEITSVSFTTENEPVRLDCDAFFAYCQKGVDYDAFKAINDSCLVYDGKLVIDATFHTNDISIRGAGTLTKFKRRYHAEQWTHANFNSKEVGFHLASEMLRLFDPTLEPQSEPSEEILNLIPMYRSPKIQGALLPGGYHYLHVAKPGLDTPLEHQMAQSEYGRVLITGSPEKDEPYFRLHINQYNIVETITCLSKKEIPASNLICLFGIHEQMLNNLLSRFDEGLIKDFYSYFMETWCQAIYHDRFSDFRDEVRELLVTNSGPDMASVEEEVRQIVDEDLPMTQEKKDKILEAYLKSDSNRAVEMRFLNFLNYNYYHLPMYAKPGMV